MDLTAHVGEAGEEYNENMEVDPNKRTELFEVAAHPGVDRSDALHDFKPVSFISLLSPILFSKQFNMYICTDEFQKLPKVTSYTANQNFIIQDLG